jgi:tRNA (guanine37-N1)-methyltransferase
MNSADLPEIFRPPVNRSMRVLDRNFFQKTLPIAAATVFDDRNLSSVRNELQISGNLLGVFSIKAVVPDETVSGRKCVLLQPGVLATGMLMLYLLSSRLLLMPVPEPMTWSPAITKLVENKMVGLRPYDLKLDYDNWTMRTLIVPDCILSRFLTCLENILEATLPEFDQDEKDTPAGFALVGHVGERRCESILAISHNTSTFEYARAVSTV